ncbi:hypothetical protein PTKIN_Ptkin15bG0089100 [Pterospermum kingtungense]
MLLYRKQSVQSDQGQHADSVVKWMPPSDDWFKINCDEAFLKDSKSAEIGIVIRKSDGKLVDAFCKKVLADNALNVEAVKEGIMLVVNKGYEKVVIETDSLTVYNEIGGSNKSRVWNIWPIVKDIRRLQQNLLEVRFSVVKGNANMVADRVFDRATKGMWGGFSIIHPLENIGVS